MRYIIILLLFLASSVEAAQRTIEAEWGYTPPSTPALTGFALYKEGSKVCTFTGASLRKASCIVDLLNGTNSFTLTATFADNTESPHSATYTLAVVPGPTILSIKIM